MSFLTPPGWGPDEDEDEWEGDGLPWAILYVGLIVCGLLFAVAGLLL
jgi:hypothetical protein